MMQTSIAVVGGVYQEYCLWPEWDQVFGSAGRAAAALSSHIDEVRLFTALAPSLEQRAKQLANVYGFELIIHSSNAPISFEYVHCMSTPTIHPPPWRIHRNPTLEVHGDVVLRFGMMDGDAKVQAEWCVYDPQSAYSPESFWKNGSKATHLAIVANRSEICAMASESDVDLAASKLLNSGAEVVVVKSGAVGAFVFTHDGGKSIVPAFQSENVWTIGSGDVFAAIFTAGWAVHKLTPKEAALQASVAVSCYAESFSLPSPTRPELAKIDRTPVSVVPGRVYLAGPFFNLAQRWMIDEARRGLTEVGLDVFSPVHDVGPGPAWEVAPKDLEALDSCDRVFALLDGIDTGTVFEIGYARAKGIPVYTLAQSVSEEDMKMVVGSGCKVFYDFVTAMHHCAWHK
ncbi:PfkB family carbohydrate kinase [Rhodoferax mekongensis]|uniref:PfkB family carbohydrate kinase n=1 Tax=Rhodoferax mekongensis TaxID=3068341 RepID=A0ABZ0AZ36_9BURK|nr:PfkB family carbohydrate kinase [Rhodoferax sp. TBRC 17307]WNO04009.1 PfkB family carbohydrate kinase [Rhodoferax sp. TBRC 17307]